MAHQEHRSRTNQSDRGESPEPGFENAAEPADTNYEHPTPVGDRVAVPGAGVVRETADAGPVESDPDRSQHRDFPGHGPGPLLGANASRPGTTRSGVASVPDRAGASSTTTVTETASDGGEAPLSVPTDTVGPIPAATRVREISDPNYTAASRPFDASAERPRRRRVGPDARVADAMTRELDYCEPGTLVQYVARMMADKDVGAIPVVENSDSMKPVGIITDRDIAIRVVAKNQDAATLRADQAMSSNVFTIGQNEPLNEAVLLMQRQQVRRLLVVDDRKRLVGMLSQGDIAESAPDDETAAMLRGISEPPGPGTSSAYH